MLKKTAKLDLPSISKIIAIASGKGGVGKSTIAVNVALALAQEGHRVGLLDADIYGPSIPKMLDVEGHQIDKEEGKLIPVEKWGLKIMSIGFFVDPEKAVIWRGPMVQTAIRQMLGDVKWGDLDYLIVDLPPGTGDTQLSMVQLVPLSGAIIVSTPQDIALIDARKGLQMFEQVSVPILGMIENMSRFCCPNCGHMTAIFGEGGAKAEAMRLGVPFLGNLPLLPSIRLGGDAGQPIMMSGDTTSKALISEMISAVLSSHEKSQDK